MLAATMLCLSRVWGEGEHSFAGVGLVWILVTSDTSAANIPERVDVILQPAQCIGLLISHKHPDSNTTLPY